MLLEQHPRIAVLQQSGLLHALQPLHKWWRSRGGYGKRVVSYSEVAAENCGSAERRDFFVGDLFPHQPKAVGAIWRSYAEKIRDLKQQTDRILEVRYEDLINDGEVQLSSILSWLHLEFDSTFVEKALQNCSMEKLRRASVTPPIFLRQGTATGWRNEISQRQAACVEYGAHPSMEIYGYQPTSARPERAPLPVRIRASVQQILGPAVDRMRPMLKRATRLAGR